MNKKIVFFVSVLSVNGLVQTGWQDTLQGGLSGLGSVLSGSDSSSAVSALSLTEIAGEAKGSIGARC